MSPLSGICFANIFSPSVACLINSLNISFDKCNLFVLMKFGFLILYILDGTFDVLAKTFCPEILKTLYFPLEALLIYISHFCL